MSVAAVDQTAVSWAQSHRQQPYAQIQQEPEAARKAPALGHWFGPDLRCPCGVEFGRHQRNPTACPDPHEPRCPKVRAVRDEFEENWTGDFNSSK